MTPAVAFATDVDDVLYSSNMTAIATQTQGLRPAWSAAVVADLPYTPHSLSIYVTTANTHTLEGMSRGTNELHYGFEFMIPFTNFGRYSAWFYKEPAAQPQTGTGTPSTQSAAGQDIGIATFKFDPADVTVTAGTTVRWTNHDAIAHTVTADDNSWDSGLLATGTSWSHTFDKAGDFSYHCTPHPFMKGTIHVK